MCVPPTISYPIYLIYYQYLFEIFIVSIYFMIFLEFMYVINKICRSFLLKSEVGKWRMKKKRKTNPRRTFDISKCLALDPLTKR